MKHFRSKPTEVVAIQWDGKDATADQMQDAGVPVKARERDEGDRLALLLRAGVDGSQGYVPVPVGHWIVWRPGEENDYWPVEDAQFRAKYERHEPWGEA